MTFVNQSSERVGLPRRRNRMKKPATAEERAQTLISVGRKEHGTAWFVWLRIGGAPSVEFGPYLNHALAQDDAHKFRLFLAAVIREVETS
jgi:hypothetical protein